MARSRGSGTVRKEKGGTFVARVRWRDDSGKRHAMRRVFTTRTAAVEALEEFNRSRDRLGPEVLDLERRTFADLADLFERTYCGVPVYRQGIKVTGLRSRKDVLARLGMLRKHFGARRVRDITTGELERFKAARLATPTPGGPEGKGKPRSIATVNRELAILRRVLNVAVQERWIDRNPFASARPLIQVAAEEPRDRVLSRDEERRLLDACVGPWGHLRRVIIVAVDTGCRRGELLALRWADVDLVGARLVVRASNSKTMKARTVPLTRRAVEALRELGEGDGAADAQVFGKASSIPRIRKHLALACTAAGIVGLRFHDLRATCGTRLATSGVPLTEVARMLGHADTKTTFRFYVGEGEGALDRAAAALERFIGDDEETVGGMVS